MMSNSYRQLCVGKPSFIPSKLECTIYDEDPLSSGLVSAMIEKTAVRQQFMDISAHQEIMKLMEEG